MSIRWMIPMGAIQRRCIVCAAPIHAKTDELTVHELKCLGVPYEQDNDDAEHPKNVRS